MSKMYPKVVYHIAAMGNWTDLIQDQFGLLRDSGLNKEPVTVTFVGQPINLVYRIAKLFDVEIDVVKQDIVTDHYETFAMIEIDRLCKVEKIDQPILYFHTKGVSNPCVHKRSWRLAMESLLIKNWEENIKHLQEGYDAVGPFWIDWGRQHFSGNFWMANPDWIRRLPDFIPYHNIMGLNRFNCETWIGAQQWCRAYSLGAHGGQPASNKSDAEIYSYIQRPFHNPDKEYISVSLRSGYGKVGDTLMTEPALYELGRRYDKKIKYFCPKKVHGIFINHPYIEPIEEPFEKPDYYISALESLYWASENYTPVSHGAFHQVRIQVDNSMRDRYKSFNENEISIEFENSVLICPYSHCCRSRNWGDGTRNGNPPNVMPGLSWWDKVIDAIPVNYNVFVICGSNKEWDWPHRFGRAIRIEGLGYRETLAAMRASSLCIAVNTGLAHLAASTNTPLILLSCIGPVYESSTAIHVRAPNERADLFNQDEVISKALEILKNKNKTDS